MNPTNEEFLQAVFRDDAPNVHVTDFSYDPSAIPSDRHLAAWAGDRFNQYNFGKKTNQYFTISIFKSDETGKARRRKALFRHTSVIVLDDVKEKLPLEQVQRLPTPSYILETSKGSEQWGYILTEPCSNRNMVENLLDGLIDHGLAPNGKDPGMKGVTRYVRLPEGWNLKKSKGEFKCHMMQWTPFYRYDIHELAKPFNVDLYRERRESRVDGAAEIDHPVKDLVHIKEVRSAGRFDITCPWLSEHTKQEDSGSAVFTNGDGSIGFKCHHGSCQDKTGKDLLIFLEEKKPGFGEEFAKWKFSNAIKDIKIEAKPELDKLVDDFKHETDRKKRRAFAASILQEVEALSEMEKVDYHKVVCEVMDWDKKEFKQVLTDLKSKWKKPKEVINFFDEVIFIAEANHFYNREKRIFYTPEAYGNAYCHMEKNARSLALEGKVFKVDKLDYIPNAKPVVIIDGITYGNSWSTTGEMQGRPGDITPWWEHWEVIGWAEFREHAIQWMAYTIQKPQHKINHLMLMGGPEGAGKDFLLYPLIKAMGRNSKTINGSDLIDGFNDYILCTKHVHVNEAELGENNDAKHTGTLIKPMSCAPPETIRVNRKNISKIEVRNIINLTMTSNSRSPIYLKDQSRRIFALWTDLNVRLRSGEMREDWRRYWRGCWEWMNNGGLDAVINYLRNVDVSNFRASEAPPVTDYLRDMVKGSKMQIELIIEEQCLEFPSVCTSEELFERLRINMQTGKCEHLSLSVYKLEDVLRKFAIKNGDLWIINNFSTYETMSYEELKLYRQRGKVDLKLVFPLTFI